MRSFLWVTLLAQCVMVALVQIPSPSRASARIEVNVNVTKASGKALAFSAKVEGFGTTEEDARDKAIRRASERIGEFLAEPPYNEGGYKPTREYLQQARIVPSMSDIDVSDDTLPTLGAVKRAELQVSVTEDQVKAMKEQARQERIGQRQHWMGIVLASIVALLLVVAGYLRLEEATKGFYTGVLRLTALGILALVGVIIWQLS